ncbi:aldose epimerase family protein [Pendulispora albinea]|uniref:Aldose 1-epimerase n=1 Tax=Pendulispora albinea TaxID=2741071 RepID=A0ABZ2LXV4_9BACT
MTRELFGKGPDGEDVHRYVLTNAAGVSVDLISYGATVRTLNVPDRDGKPRNVVLGFATMEGYLGHHPRLGATMGRFANRIAGATFTLDGTVHRLPVTHGGNTLHGGKRGFDQYTWREIEAGAGPEGQRVVFEHTSPDGDEGFPGTFTVRVTYTLTAKNELCIDYLATTDKPTVANLTNHSYFNLSGEGSGDILDHELVLFADAFAPVRADQIPTGELQDVTGTPFDFRTATPIGARIRQGHEQLVYGWGYDHCYVVNRPAGAPADQPIHAARVRSPKSGIVLDTYTTEPGIEFFTGNVLTGALVGPSGSTYRQCDGFCLETQKFPDSPNQPSFPSSVVRPGTPLRSRTIYQFGVG